jgi:murein DD-endopeptidase MepM/ murein hydrolase activator NlpD
LRLSSETRPRLRQFVAALRERTRRTVDRHLPERQIILRTDRRVRAMVITQRAQLWALATVVAFLAWSGYATISVTFRGAILAAKDREIGTVRLANANLRQQMQEAEDRFATITGRLEAKHAYLMGLLERTEVSAPAKSGGGKSRGKQASADRLTQSREAVRNELAQLGRVLSADPKDMAASDELLRDRSGALAESERLQARLGAIEARLGELRLAQQSTMTRLAHRALSNLDQVKEMIAGLGLDVNRVLGRGMARVPKGVGGPFVPLSAAEARGAIPASVGSTDRAVARWEGVQQALKLLPLGAPVDHVTVTSGFGRRTDPFNGLPAFHSGLDLSGAMGTPIHATAPGRVTYAGINGGYGRMVEIDHGHGLVTRYAHLSRFLVRRGDRVHYRQVIGLMGETGRATGVHVHYEVLVDGKPRDPTKFIEAGSYVLVQR